MQAKIALSTFVVAATAFAGSAFAETPTIDTTPFVSTQSRAQVQAELAAFKKSGVNPWSIQYNPLKNFQSGTTRAQVTAEYLASRDLVDAFTGEDSGSSYLAQNRVPGAEPSLLAGQPAIVR